MSLTQEQKDFIRPILETFENDDIKKFAAILVSDFPEYIWKVGASSTAKYHPAYTLGEYGLMKHQVAVCRFMNFFLELEQYRNRYDSRQRDCMRVAALVHDGRKSGTQEDFEKNKYTKFDHPLLMAKVVASYVGKDIIPDEEIKFIARCIGTHMGQWNEDKRSDIVLPKPTAEPQELVHLADYLASRKCLNMDFSDYAVPEKEIEIPSLDSFKMPFGKHKNTLLKDIPRDYLQWLKGTNLNEPLKTLVDKVLKAEE